jgi:hypothetical protein
VLALVWTGAGLILLAVSTWGIRRRLRRDPALAALLARRWTLHLYALDNGPLFVVLGLFCLLPLPLRLNFGVFWIVIYIYASPKRLWLLWTGPS